MSQVISLSAHLNSKRAEAELARREASATQRMDQKAGAIMDAIEAKIGPMPLEAQLVVLGVVEAAEKARAPQFMPAYCDPTNEVRGIKHEATKSLSPAEIASRIRADIKAAQKGGTIPACTISVRTKTYSGGCSIDVRVTALPEGFRVTSDRYASWLKQFGANSHRNVPMAWADCQSEELLDLLAKLSAIMSAYNRDNSDGMSDYFDRRFYGDASIDWQLRDRLQAAEVEASAGDVWGESCGG